MALSCKIESGQKFNESEDVMDDFEESDEEEYNVVSDSDQLE